MSSCKELVMGESCTKEVRRKSLISREVSVIGCSGSTGSRASVDFETGINETGFGKFNYALLCLSLTLSSITGITTGSISFVMPYAVCEFSLNSFEEGALNAACFAGMALSAYPWGLLSDAFGRQRLIAVGCLIDAAFTISSAFAPNFWVMFTLKFLGGIMISGPTSIITTYVAEIFNKKYRDLAVLSTGLSYAVGLIILPGVAMGFLPLNIRIFLYEKVELTSWRLFLALTSLPSLICGIFSSCFVESPIFLLEQGRHEEALRACQKIYTINTGRPVETYPVKRLSVPKMMGTSDKTVWCDKNENVAKIIWEKWLDTLSIFRNPYQTKTLLCFGIFFGICTSMNFVRLYLPIIFSEESKNDLLTFNSSEINNTQNSLRLCDVVMESWGQSKEKNCSLVEMEYPAFTYMMFIYLATFVLQGIILGVLKYLSKKWILFVETLVSGVAVLFMPLLLPVYSLPLATAYISFLSTSCFIFVGIVVEIFPTKVRATVVGLNAMIARLGVLMTNMAYTPLLHTHCSILFYIFFAVLCGCTLLVYLLPDIPATAHENREVYRVKEVLPEV